MKYLSLTFLFSIFSVLLFAQTDDNENSFIDFSKQDGLQGALHLPASGRKWLVGGTSAIGMSGSLLLNYKSMNYEYEENFHLKNDILAWRQMDKALHTFSAYTVSRYSTALWQWTGMPHNRATVTGSAAAITYMMIKEYIDGHNGKGGWSWGDAIANISGTGFFVAQELAWKEQKLQLKISTRLKSYDPSLQERTDKLFGSNNLKKLVKDYNAQTFWVSCNLKSILNLKKFPSWLSLSLGMGAEDMYGNYANIIYDDDEGNTSFDRSDIKRYRQWYIAPDIDLTKIKTSSKALRTLFIVFNSIKIPTPALEFSKSRFRGHFLYF